MKQKWFNTPLDDIVRHEAEVNEFIKKVKVVKTENWSLGGSWVTVIDYEM